MKKQWFSFFIKYFPTTAGGPLYKGTHCMLWTGSTAGRGYGQIHVNGVKHYMHRLSYEKYYNKKLGYDIEVHHKCENKTCYNPLHLKAVTPAQHGKLHIKDFCNKGHDTRDPDSRYKHGNCKICHNYDNKMKARRKKLSNGKY